MKARELRELLKESSDQNKDIMFRTKSVDSSLCDFRSFSDKLILEIGEESIFSEATTCFTKPGEGAPWAVLVVQKIRKIIFPASRGTGGNEMLEILRELKDFIDGLLLSAENKI